MILALIILGLLLLYTYLIYPVILIFMANLRRQRRGDEGQKEMSFPYVSMVVSAYNEEKDIRGKIENFLSLDYPKEKLELVIGSDGSTDRTSLLVGSFPSERIRFFEFGLRRGKVSILNDIVKEARGEIVVFSDADTIYDANAIRNLIRHFVDNDVGGVCGKLALYETADSLAEEGLYWRYENFIKRTESTIGTIVSINGQIFAIRKKLFEKLPEYIITEDQALGMSILSKGFKIVFDEDAIAREKIGNFKAEFERRVRISAGNFQSISLSLKVLNPKMGFTSLFLWSHKIMRWLVPFFLLSTYVINLFLLDIPIFQLTFFLQTIFYAVPILYYVLTKTGLDVTIFKIVSYFIVMNLAILIGFFKYITKTQKVTWQKAR